VPVPRSEGGMNEDEDEAAIRAATDLKPGS
jgi:hypothetical protein